MKKAVTKAGLTALAIFLITVFGFLSADALAEKADDKMNAREVASSPEKSDENQKLQMQNSYGNFPLYFIQNNGQVDEKVKYYEKGAGHATYFTGEGV